MLDVSTGFSPKPVCLYNSKQLNENCGGSSRGFLRLTYLNMLKLSFAQYSEKVKNRQPYCFL